MNTAGLRFLVLVLAVCLIGSTAPVQAQGTFAHGAVVALQGTPHLWFADEQGVLHWGGDTRALAGKHIAWSNRVEVSLDQLRTLPVGDPWLSAGLLKDGDPIYLVKWETDWPQPQLLHIQSIGDVELFGINGSNYGKFVIDRPVWEQRYGIDADTLNRFPLASAVQPLAAPPAPLGLDPFYTKYLDVLGIPIIASSQAADGALVRAKAIIAEMLRNRPDLAATIARAGRTVTIVAASEVITDIPAFRDLYRRYPDIDWNARVQGGGLSGNEDDPTTAVWGQHILCVTEDVYPNEDILVHEFAHTVLNMGVERQPNGRAFKKRLTAAYAAAKRAGRWRGTYASENVEEYWAEGVQSWFGLNDPPGPIHNDINSRQAVEQYDPTLAALIREVFGDTVITTSCHGP